MKIIKLTAENIKKLVAVEISPDGNLVQITGKNGAGKTSVLDSIWWALAGTKHIQTQPIRKGANKAKITLDLGEITVERKFTDKGSTLAVESAKGARYSSPQTMLDNLLGALTFDPLAFSRMEPRKQFDELRSISEISIDLDELDALNKGDYSKRTDMNRDHKALVAQAEAIIVKDGLPDAPVNESALVDQLEKAGETNAEIETRKNRREQTRRDANDKKSEGMRLNDRAAELHAQAKEIENQGRKALNAAGELEKKIDAAKPLPEPVDTTAIRAKIGEANEINACIEHRTRRAELVTEYQALAKQSEEITERMDAREATKSEAIKNAKMPVDGIGFGDGMVLLNGIPFDQASDAEKLKVSLAIAMASNPELKVIRIQDGSLLDDDSMKYLAKMAEEHDYQVWIERVDGSGKVGVVIEDGVVKAND